MNTYKEDAIKTAYVLAWWNISSKKFDKNTPTEHYKEFMMILHNTGARA